MENLKKSVVVCGALIFFSACNYADLPGMFVVGESVNDRFEQSMQYNSENQPVEIIVSNSEYIICVAADVHIGSTKNFDKFLLKSKQINAEAVVLNGDICNGNDYDYDLLEQHLPAFSQQKYFMLVGNHELYFDGWEHYFEKFGSSTYYFTVKTPNASDLFICLDSGSGTLGKKQINWFKELLKNNRSNFRHCIVFTHNNLYRIRRTASTNPVVHEMRVLTDLFARYDVNMVVTGHDHIRNVLEVGKTTHITMDALLDGFLEASFLKLTIQHEKIAHEFIKN
jgi:UDP-2,3-diacylglucosamine pyrophosphatase LpxH